MPTSTQGGEYNIPEAAGFNITFALRKYHSACGISLFYLASNDTKYYNRKRSKERGIGVMEKYIKIYHKRNVQLVFICASIIFLPLFITSLFYDKVPGDIWIAFVPFALAPICVAVASLYTIRFRKLIAKQEQAYHIQFQDNNVEHLETTLYLSDDWLIWAGSCAFYKKHIKSISSVRRFGQAGSSNQVTIKTIDDKKYTVWCLSASNVKKLKEWQKS